MSDSERVGAMWMSRDKPVRERYKLATSIQLQKDA